MNAHTDPAATPDPRPELDSLDILACVREIACTSAPALPQLAEDNTLDPFDMEVDPNTNYTRVCINPFIFKNADEFYHCTGSTLSDACWKKCTEDNIYLCVPYEICDGYCCSLAEANFRSKNRFLLVLAIALSTGKNITDVHEITVSDFCDDFYSTDSEAGHNSGGDWPEYYSEDEDDPDPMDMARRLFNWCVRVVANANMELASSNPGKIVELL